MSTTPPLSSTDRTRLGRHSERAAADRAALHDVLDNGLICHLGVVVDGSPRVLPTGYGRIGDTLYLHGSTGARSLIDGPAGEICVTVTVVDGIVLARSAFHHSMNYRSAVAFGVPRLVTDEAERWAALAAITEHLAPGRWAATRQPVRKELAATAVLALSLDEASVKARTGGPADDPEDVATGLWAGVMPVELAYRAPRTDALVPAGTPVPAHVTARVTTS